MAKKDKTLYLCIGPHGWARADRPDRALQQCIDYIAYWENYEKVPFKTYTCDKHARVNEMGGITFRKDKREPKLYMTHEIPVAAIRAFKDAQGGLDHGDEEDYYTYAEDDDE